MNEHLKCSLEVLKLKLTEAGFDSYQNLVIYDVLDLNASRKPV